MGRFQRSVYLGKASWDVLRQDKQLMVLPLLSFLATAVTIALFGLGVVATGERPATGFAMSPVGWVLAAVGYFALALVTVYFNAALVSAANERLSGGDPTIDSALGGANARLPQILGWALVSATVSMFLRQIQERSGLLGRLVTGLVGLAWSLVTYLVLPIIVIEGAGVKNAVVRSKDLFTRTWGERVVGNTGIGIIGLIAMLPAVPLVVVGAVTGVPGALAATIAIAAIWVSVVACATTAMSMIFQTALYRYAAAGEAPGGWDHATLAAAFPAKAPRRGFLSG